MKNPSELVVRCPQCRERGTWFATRWGPFCSERCKLIDLGRWFNEDNKISRELRPGDFAGYDGLEPGPHLDQPPDSSR